MESFSVVKDDSLVEITDTEIINSFKKAFNAAKKQSGVVNMADPEYKVELGKETYYLWISEESGTIMNTKDTHSIYSLDRNSAKKINGAIMKDFKATDNKELSTQDFETVYKLGKTFLSDYYSHKAGYSAINFKKYIINDNLLKYSNKRVLVENYVLDIKEISIGLEEAHFIPDENSYYLEYNVVALDNNIGSFAEKVELFITNLNGNLVISDWYMPHGSGSSSFDEKFRPNELIRSPRMWDDKNYVNDIFEKIEKIN